MARKLKRRETYRPDHSLRVARIETARKALGLSVAALAFKAGINERTVHRIRKSGRCWNRHIRALEVAMRSLRAEAARAGTMFPTGET